jgi:EamA domain-containing membrane protein RarD
MLLEPLLTAFFAFLIFAEKLSILNCFAFIIVLIGIGGASFRCGIIHTAAGGSCPDTGAI